MLLTYMIDKLWAGISLDLSERLNKKKISIVMPMYNEESTISSVISNIPRLPNYEIIIVDDGSEDKSREVVRNFRRVTLYCHKKNRGYGKTIIDGVQKATGDIIVIMDSDGQHDPSDIIRLIEPIVQKRAEMTIGSRYRGQYSYQLSLTSRLGEAFLQNMIAILFGKKIQANQGGFRALRRDVAQKIFEDSRFTGFAFATEAILQAILGKNHIEEVPIHLHDRKNGKSRVKKFKLLFSLVCCLAYYAAKRYLGENSSNKFFNLIQRIKLGKF